MTDDQLAKVLEAFVRDVRGRGTKEPEGKPPGAAGAAQHLAAKPEDGKAPEVTAAISTRASAPWWPARIVWGTVAIG
jgi:hypothetical protein